MNKHFGAITRARMAQPAVTSFTVKLEGMTAIIDRLLLVPRQQPWKATGPVGNPGDTDIDTGIDPGIEL